MKFCIYLFARFYAFFQQNIYFELLRMGRGDRRRGNYMVLHTIHSGVLKNADPVITL